MNKFFLSVATVMLLSGCCHRHHGHERVYVVEEPIVVEKPSDSDRVYVEDRQTGRVYIKDRPQLVAPE